MTLNRAVQFGQEISMHARLWNFVFYKKLIRTTQGSQLYADAPSM